VSEFGNERRPMLLANDTAIDTLPPPPKEHLRWIAPGFSDAEQARLATARGVRPILVMAPTDDWARTMSDANALLAALADRRGCFVFDESEELAFTPRTWREDRVAKLDPAQPHLATQITAHTYRDGELNRMVPLGMEKAGLPDVSIDQVPGQVAEMMEALLLLVCAAIATAPANAERVHVTSR